MQKGNEMKIGSSNDSEAVKEQYSTSKGLDIRIAFHDKYSTNKQGYGSWLVSNYDIRKGMSVLDIKTPRLIQFKYSSPILPLEG